MGRSWVTKDDPFPSIHLCHQLGRSWVTKDDPFPSIHLCQGCFSLLHDDDADDNDGDDDEQRWQLQPVGDPLPGTKIFYQY